MPYQLNMLGWSGDETIEVEDLSELSVLDRDGSRPMYPDEIAEVYHNSPARLLAVSISLAGDTSGDTVILATEGHPFYAPSRGWVAAQDLRPGDILKTNREIRAKVRGVKVTGRIEPVFNLRVDSAHTYFVVVPGSTTAVLVHNDSSTQPAASQPVNQSIREPNWGGGVGSVEHNLAALTLNFPKHTVFSADKLADQIYRDLAAFTYFNPNPDAILEIKGGIGYFTLTGIAKPGSYMVGDDVPFAVQLTDDDSTRTVRAATLGNHVLVGERRWSVGVLNQNPPRLLIKTEAYDQPNGRANQASLGLGGRSAQIETWTAYLNQLASHYEQAFDAKTDGAVTIPEQDIGTANPWEPNARVPK